MSDAATLLALADRCEREKPSPSLDIDIDIATDPDPLIKKAKSEIWEQNRWRPEFLKTVFGSPEPAFTTSLDAAITLVPEGWVYSLNTFPNGASAYVMFADSRMVRPKQQYVRSAALAICAVALRARAAMTHSSPPESAAARSDATHKA